jgi:mono/diheme cytochrome c family protein
LFLGAAGFVFWVVFQLEVSSIAELSGESDVWAAEVPADPKNPFAVTLSERRLKAIYSEPPQKEVAVPVSSANKLAELQRSVPEAAMKRAGIIYSQRCVACHGEKGDGAGPGAFAVKPKPRNYTDAEWQKTVTDEELAKAIVRGGLAVGKSYMMPASYDLKSKPDVVNALVVIIRSFGVAGAE